MIRLLKHDKQLRDVGGAVVMVSGNGKSTLKDIIAKQ
jgi:hypothetical protein